jgi:integrase
VATLAYTGVRVTELCDLNVGDVDLRHAKLSVTDAKTEAGVRQVDMTPYVVEIVSAYFAWRGSLTADEPAFPDWKGQPRNKDQANKQTILPAWRLANDLRAERGESRCGA